MPTRSSRTRPLAGKSIAPAKLSSVDLPHLGFFTPKASDFGTLKAHRDGTTSVYIKDPAGNSIQLLETRRYDEGVLVLAVSGRRGEAWQVHLFDLQNTSTHLR